MISKKIIILMMLFLILSNNVSFGICSTDCNVCSHTTFVPRTMAQNSVLELALHNYYSYHMQECVECPPWISLQVTAPYFFKSTKKHELAEYFLPKCKQCITVAQNNTSDVSSLWLGIISPVNSPFSSTFCIRPTRTVIGGALRLFFDFRSWLSCDDCWANNWWASIFIPIQQVRHDLHMQEMANLGSGTPTVPPSFPNVITALNNVNWNFGKLSPKKLKKTGVDDICVKIGFDVKRDACKHLSLYGLAFIPTGHGTKAKYLFEPLVGTKHAGVGVGINFDGLAYSCNSRSINFMVDARYAHLFKHKEIRSIDLFNGDWSRYLLVVTEANPTRPLPGINFFTQEVMVNPRSMFEIWSALSFNCCNWHLEVGYDFWMRLKEKIKLPEKDLGVGILDIAFNPNLQCPTTAHCARICQAIANQPDAPVSDSPLFITVKNSDLANKQGTSFNGNVCNGPKCIQQTQCSFLNLDSAAHPRALSSTIYASISWDGCVCCNPVMVGIGGQYEFAHRHGALSQYGVWLKTAISF